MQEAQWLDFRQLLLARDEYRYTHEQNSIDDEGSAKKLHRTEAVAARKPYKGEQNGEGREQAQPFVPGPIAQKKIRPRLEYGVILRSDRWKQGRGKVRNPFGNSYGGWKKFQSDEHRQKSGGIDGHERVDRCGEQNYKNR